MLTLACLLLLLCSQPRLTQLAKQLLDAASTADDTSVAAASSSQLQRPSARFSCRAMAIRRAKAKALQQRLPVLLDV